MWNNWQCRGTTDTSKVFYHLQQIVTLSGNRTHMDMQQLYECM